MRTSIASALALSLTLLAGCADHTPTPVVPDAAVKGAVADKQRYALAAITFDGWGEDAPALDAAARARLTRAVAEAIHVDDDGVAVVGAAPAPGTPRGPATLIQINVDGFEDGAFLVTVSATAPDGRWTVSPTRLRTRRSAPSAAEVEGPRFAIQLASAVGILLGHGTMPAQVATLDGARVTR